MKVKSVKKTYFSGKVYNIGTPPIHNYFANNVLVHNCYMGSTVNGKHADHSFLSGLAYDLKEHKVFEVAFGGGQPTKHPYFGEILSTFRYCGIVPNFTTFNMDWVDDPKIANPVIKNAGSFAVSSIDDDTISRLRKWNTESYNYNQKCDYEYSSTEKPRHRPKGSVHIPLGCYPAEKIIDFLKSKEKTDGENSNYEGMFDVMFLGYKTAGRGKNFPSFDSVPVVEYLKEKNKKDGYIRFGADTLFVKQFKKELEEMGVDKSMVVGSEGKFSCYIDAVSKKIGACSYAGRKFSLEGKNEFERGSGIFPHFPFLTAEKEEVEEVC